jgi:hypothetical protein
MWEENKMTATTKVIRFDEFGGPDILKLEEIPLAERARVSSDMHINAG